MKETLICIIPLPFPVDRFVMVAKKLAEAFPGCVIQERCNCYEIHEKHKEFKGEMEEE